MKYDRVLPNLLLGTDPRAPSDIEQLKNAGATAILSLQTAEDRGDLGVDWEARAAAAAGMEFRHTAVRDFDSADLQRRLPDCVEALDRLLKAGHTVYLHCTAGVSRSPSVAAAYLYRRMGWSFEQAMAHLKRVRNCCPNAEAIQSARWDPN